MVLKSHDADIILEVQDAEDQEAPNEVDVLVVVWDDQLVSLTYSFIQYFRPKFHLELETLWQQLTQLFYV